MIVGRCDPCLIHLIDICIHTHVYAFNLIKPSEGSQWWQMHTVQINWAMVSRSKHRSKHKILLILLLNGFWNTLGHSEIPKLRVRYSRIYLTGSRLYLTLWQSWPEMTPVFYLSQLVSGKAGCTWLSIWEFQKVPKYFRIHFLWYSGSLKILCGCNVIACFNIMPGLVHSQKYWFICMTEVVFPEYHEMLFQIQGEVSIPNR